MFELFNKWESSVKKLRNNKITAQTFVNANERKVLYYSTPFLDNEQGGFPNILQSRDESTVLFPVFSSKSGLTEHMQSVGCVQYIVIKGDLKGVLSSLDSHPTLQDWGLIIDPQSSSAVELPPQIRVQPKSLR